VEPEAHPLHPGGAGKGRRRDILVIVVVPSSSSAGHATADFKSVFGACRRTSGASVAIPSPGSALTAVNFAAFRYRAYKDLDGLQVIFT